MAFSVLQLGHGGVSGYASEGGSSTTIYDVSLKPYTGRIIDGGYAIDITVIPMGKLISASLHGPLYDPRIPDGEREACPVPSAVMCAGLEGAFSALANMKRNDPTWTGLDSVGTRDYVAYWREKGARIGQRKGAVVVWEDGKEDPVGSE